MRKLFPLKSDRLTDRDYAANPFDHLVEACTSPRTGPELPDLVDQRLATMPPSTTERTFGPLAASQDPRIAADRHGDVVARFTARAAEARRG